MKFRRRSYLWNAYLLDGTLHCCTTHLSKSEYFYDSTPLESVDARDVHACSAAILRMIQRGNPRIPDIDWSTHPRRPELLKQIGVRSWRELERKAESWTIQYGRDEDWKFGPRVAHRDGGWEGDPDLLDSLPASTDPAVVAKAVAERIAESLGQE